MTDKIAQLRLKPRKKRAGCALVKRDRTEHGLAWECPKCHSQMFLWDEKIVDAMAADREIEVQCEGCKCVHTIFKQMISTPADKRIAVPRTIPVGAPDHMDTLTGTRPKG